MFSLFPQDYALKRACLLRPDLNLGTLMRLRRTFRIEIEVHPKTPNPKP